MYCSTGLIDITVEDVCLRAGGSWSAPLLATGKCNLQSRYVYTKEDCYIAGGRWKNRTYNFDNLLQAMLTLFVVSSLDGWVEIMYHCADAVGEDMHPQQDHSWLAVVYFVLFLLIVGYFVVSMFVGVIVENFQLTMANSQDTVSDEGENTDLSLPTENDESTPLSAPPSGLIRRGCYRIVHSKHFETLFTTVTLVNVTLMATEHHNQPKWYVGTLLYLNVVFTVGYGAEMGLKIGASSVKAYFSSWWNRVDALIVLTSATGCIIDFLDASLPVSPSAINVFKIFRILRILKLAKAAPGLASLILTVRSSTKHVLNLGVLLCILFFISSSLGMELFGRIACTPESPCQGISVHANFENMGMAFLTLFRIATGDNWAGIMLDTMREPPECDDSWHCETNCCSNPGLGVTFLVSYVILAQFIMLNVVVAVLMKNLSDAVRVYNPDDDLDDLEEDEKGNFGSPNNRHTSRAALTKNEPRVPISIKTTEVTSEDIESENRVLQVQCELEAKNVIQKLQVQTEHYSTLRRESQMSNPRASHLHAHSVNQMALKASLHLVMAMVHMMNAAEKTSSTTTASRTSRMSRRATQLRPDQLLERARPSQLPAVRRGSAQRSKSADKISEC